MSLLCQARSDPLPEICNSLPPLLPPPSPHCLQYKQSFNENSHPTLMCIRYTMKPLIKMKTLLVELAYLKRATHFPIRIFCGKKPLESTCCCLQILFTLSCWFILIYMWQSQVEIKHSLAYFDPFLHSKRCSAVLPLRAGLIHAY